MKWPCAFNIRRPCGNIGSNRLFISLLVLGALFAACLYGTSRFLLFTTFFRDHNWLEGLVALFSISAEWFILVHGFFYFLSMLHVFCATRSIDARPPAESTALETTDYPPVAIVVASYKEPLFILKDTLICLYNLSYPNKRIYLLDDTRYDLSWDTPANMEAYKQALNGMCDYLKISVFRRQWHHAKAGMINDFVSFLGGKREGFEVIHSEQPVEGEEIPYLIVFDVDVNPFPKFVEPLVRRMEAHPKLAFLQTPQYYSNFENNRVARASGIVQAVFYEYICEAKGLENAMFCCGTSFIMRLQALRDVGGFDVSSVTEDFATSLSMHRKGWSSSYFKRVSSFGMGPESLGAFFKQQYRWALGTLCLFKEISKLFLCHPTAFSSVVWTQYFLSGSYYFIGLALLTLLLCPIAYLVADIHSYFVDPIVPTAYLILFFPYLLSASLLFLWTLCLRNYRCLDLALAVALTGATYSVYIKAAFDVLRGRKGRFEITPKGAAEGLSLWELWPQVGLLLTLTVACVWGALRVYYERDPFYALIINTFWCFYYFLTLLLVFYFNHAEESESI